jgi:acyl-CoA reductase-like NAD-dependent aldehyde dehydrogenase
MSKTEGIIDKACQAADAFSKLGQADTDAIVRAVYLAALSERVRLAKMAHEETGIGVWQHKVINARNY